MHAHTHTRAHGKHDNFMQMAAPIGGIPGNSLWCHMHMHVRACACVCTYVGGTLSPPPTPRINQNSIALELIEIFQFRLKIWNLWRLPHPWVGGCMVWWVGGWVYGWGQVKTLKILKFWLNQDNSILFKDLSFVETPPPMGGCVGGSMGGSVCQWVGLGQVTNNWVNLDLIEIIQFCLKIYDM